MSELASPVVIVCCAMSNLVHTKLQPTAVIKSRTVHVYTDQIHQDWPFTMPDPPTISLWVTGRMEKLRLPTNDQLVFHYWIRHAGFWLALTTPTLCLRNGIQTHCPHHCSRCADLQVELRFHFLLVWLVTTHTVRSIQQSLLCYELVPYTLIWP